MTFEELLDQAVAMLQHQGRVAYRALKRQFDLDDTTFDDLKEALLYAHPEVLDDVGRGLIWPHEGAAPPAPRSVLPQGPPRPATRPGELAPSDAERRQLTVLFCDLADSTRLSSQLDPEDLREVVLAYQATCVEIIQRFDGYIAQYLGDGLLVYFGYPQAHEDDAQRAIRAGLGILDAMGALNTGLERAKGMRLAVRIGIHTGPVVVGTMGSGGRHEQLALGETPNLAARLQSLAAPDTVAISDTTYQLVQGFFACEDLGTPPLKGVATPFRVYGVRGERTVESRFEAGRASGLTPLIGRDEELGLVLRRWAQAKAGDGQVVLLTGEPGIGKSRLLEAVREQVAAEPHVQLLYQCSPYATHTAFSPITAQLERVAHFAPGDPPAHKLDKLEALLAQSTLRVAEVSPLLAALLSLPTGDRYPPLTLSPQRQKAQTIAALIDLVAGLSRRQPVLCLVEDAHWCDPTTLEVLERLVHRVPELRALVLLTSRPEFTVPWTAAHTTALTLTRLDRTQVAAMVEELTAGKALPREVLAQILDKTDGVPLFVEELTKTVLESGLLREGDGRYVLTGPLPPLAIPATVQDSLMARLDRLAPVKEVAQLGAVLGREFAYAVLAAVSPRREPALSEALEQLVGAGLLFRRGQPPEAHYRFKHALVQDAAYASLLKSTRQQVHTHIATVLEARFPAIVETEPEMLARHYTEAGLPAQAIPYWQRAGERAMERSAHREAVGSLEQALRSLAQLPETRATREQAIDLRLALRSALIPLGDFGRILAYLREAEALAVALDDPRRLGRVSGFLARQFCFMGAYDQAIAAGQRALTLIRASGDRVLEALANQFPGIAHHAQGDYRRAIDAFGQTVMVLKGTQRHERFGQVNLPAVFSRAWLAWCHAELGTFAEGRTLGEEGLRIAEAVNHPHSLMRASWGIGLLALRQGDLPRALLLLERAMGLCQDADLPGLFLEMAAALGAAYTLAGRVADTVPLLTQAIEQAIATEMVGTQALCRLSLGEAQMLAGHLEEAHALAVQALTLARAHQERGNEAYALRLLGQIAAQLHPPEVELAEASYQQALTLADALGMCPLVAHCHLDLGNLYLTMGQREQARAELSTAIDLYRSMEMTFWLPQAEAALAEVEGC
jgi:class 3 adenylate cyclase/tetratricopeptide (TPR) repeat protein